MVPWRQPRSRSRGSNGRRYTSREGQPSNERRIRACQDGKISSCTGGPTMADRTTTESADGTRQTGEEPGAQAGTAVLEDAESLRNRVTGAEQQRDEYRALLQRTRADFENYQKRIQRDLAEERRFAPAA